MTPRIWVERPIRSVEDAEALPVGTVAIDTDHAELAAAPNRGPGRAFIRAAHWEDSCLPWHNDDDGAQWHAAVVGMVALVPVEAEEHRGHFPDGTPARWYSTPWEPAP